MIVLIQICCQFREDSHLYLLQLQMAHQLNGSCYYRANPYFRQGYLPDSAYQNRKMPTYLAELPQGEQYFAPSNKKHFQRVGYFSTIAQEQLIAHDSPDESSSPAKDKDYFRPLNIRDIQGASTNTLVSQALKNRRRAQQLARKQKTSEYESKEKQMRYKATANQNMQRQALEKLRIQRMDSNYHEKTKRFKTENYQSNHQPEPYFQHSGGNVSNHNNEKEYYSNNRQELENTQKQIRNLEDRLRQAQQRAKKEESDYFAMKMNQQTKQQSIQTNREEAIHQAQQRANEGNKQRSYSNFSIGYDPKKEKSKNNLHKLPAISRNILNLNNVDLPIYQQKPLSREQKRQRSITENSHSYNKVNIYPQEDHIIEKVEPSHKPIERENQEDVLKRSRQIRQQHRRYNPTYLSSDSMSIGLAGKNIVGLGR